MAHINFWCCSVPCRNGSRIPRLHVSAASSASRCAENKGPRCEGATFYLLIFECFCCWQKRRIFLIPASLSTKYHLHLCCILCIRNTHIWKIDSAFMIPNRTFMDVLTWTPCRFRQTMVQSRCVVVGFGWGRTFWSTSKFLVTYGPVSCLVWWHS